MDERNDFEEEFVRLAVVEGISPDYAESYYRLLFELCTGLASRIDEDLLIIGVAGAQGSGKSTLAKLLAVIMERVFEKNSLVTSLDDFYLTHDERQKLGEKVHPMLKTRGVPGTHDIPLLQSVINDLKAHRPTDVPYFDKGEDDRAGFTPVSGGSLQVLVIEGWCWGATSCDPAELDEAYNELEAHYDADGRWRRYVNEQLSTGGYQQVFSEAHTNFFLAVPDMASVVRWRWQQEQRLALNSSAPRIMSEDQVREFIMYYERITERMLREMPGRANLTLYLDEQHRVIPPPRKR